MELSPIDNAIVIIYGIVVILIGFLSGKSKEKNYNESENFLLAGRKLTLPFFVASLVATWYGAILGIGEFVYKDGFVAWICLGLPYYIAAGIFGVFIAGKIRELNLKTIPEQILQYYGSKASHISALIILIITIPASYLLMIGVIVKLFTGWSLFVCILVSGVASTIFLFMGGFKANVMTNTFQFVIMYLGFGVLLFFTIMEFGGIGTMLDKLPERHKSIFGGYNWQYIVSWFIIAFQTFIDPSFHQRCSSAKTPKTAQRGILISIIFWAIFDFLTITTGLYARAYFDIADPLMSYPVLGDSVLPSFGKGIFLIALISVVVSTLESYSFICGATIGNDILGFYKSKSKFLKNITEKHLLQIGLFLAIILSIVMSALLPSVIELIYRTSSIAVPALIVPMLFTFSKKYFLTDKKAIIIMITSSAVAGIWTIFTFLSKKFSNIFFEIFTFTEPMIVGILVSIILGIIYAKRKSSN